MKHFETINQTLDFAIEQEQVAIDFYSDLAKNNDNKEIKKVFLDFVKEEMGHKTKLLKVKSEGLFQEEVNIEILDLKISDYLANVKTSPEMTYQDALVVAMQRERSAFKLYTKLAAMAPNPEIKSLFKNLAKEEANHKLQFELEYDEHILREN